jgi:DNA invertase Pin-like site-specific DNA recombinase
MIVGYARTSTEDQDAGLEAQIRELKAFGVERVFSEKVSSVAQREQLRQALDFLREGDTLVVCKPDRLARSTRELLAIKDALKARKVGLVVLSIGGQQIDTRNPTSELILTILAGVAQWERQIMLERQREGIAKAKAEDQKLPPGDPERKYRGQFPKARAKAAEIRRLAAEGVTREKTAKQLGIGVASVYRILAEAKREAA